MCLDPHPFTGSSNSIDDKCQPSARAVDFHGVRSYRRPFLSDMFRELSTTLGNWSSIFGHHSIIIDLLRTLNQFGKSTLGSVTDYFSDGIIGSVNNSRYGSHPVADSFLAVCLDGLF